MFALRRLYHPQLTATSSPYVPVLFNIKCYKSNKSYNDKSSSSAEQKIPNDINNEILKFERKSATQFKNTQNDGSDDGQKIFSKPVRKNVNNNQKPLTLDRNELEQHSSGNRRDQRNNRKTSNVQSKFKEAQYADTQQKSKSLQQQEQNLSSSSSSTSLSSMQDLLMSMTVNRKQKKSSDNLALARPVGNKKINEQRQQQNLPKKPIENFELVDTDSHDIKNLTKQVAQTITKDQSKSDDVEKELLDALRGHRISSSATKQSIQRLKSSPISSPSPTHKRPVATGVETDTPQQDNDGDKQKVTDAFSSLLRDLKLNMSSQTSSSRTEGFVRDVVEGSYVSPKYSGGRDDSDRKSDSQRATDTVDGGRRIKDSRKKQEYYRAHRLWSGKPLNIFTTDDFKEDVLASTVPPIWQKCEQDEIDRISMIPPRNAFEEMIRWTKDGILWKFPIDNEQDIGPEADIPFYEHVLLERHLHGFPDKPLIRQFMELVCTGLGRNPFWTVEQKVDHINWFRDYFNEKLSVFNETVQSGQIIATTPTSGSTAAVTAASAPPIKTTVPPVKTIVPPPKTTPSATVTTKK